MPPLPVGSVETEPLAHDRLGPPAEGDLLIVAQANDVEPTRFSAQRHVAQDPHGDTYYVTWTDSGVWFKHWDSALELWSATSSPGADLVSAFAPSIVATTGGAAMLFTGSDDGQEFDLCFSSYDRNALSWTDPVRLGAADGVHTAYGALVKGDADGWLAVGVEGDGAPSVVSFVSADDGATWTRSTVALQVNDTWLLPTAAHDPATGDLYVAYQNTATGPEGLDLVIQRSSDRGSTWSAPQVVAEGGPRHQNVAPSLVVDHDRMVHLVYQANLAEEVDGGLVGLAQTGPLGVPWYARGRFVDEEWWAEGAPQPLASRADLAALPDSCGLSPDTTNVATDTLSQFPQLGIYRGVGGDRLHACVSQPYIAVPGGGAWELCGTWQVFVQTLDRRLGDTRFSARRQVSRITEIEAEAGRSALYAGLGHEIDARDPGMIWGEANAALPPAEVLFSRPESVGIDGDTPSTVRSTPNRLHSAAPNPFNPRTRISFDLQTAGDARLTIHDLSGRALRTLIDGRCGAGRHQATWDGRGDGGVSVASGVYLYRLETEHGVVTRRMLLVK